MDTLSESISIYFPKSNSSLLKRIRLQGLFSRGEIIPTQKDLPPGIIFPSRNHPNTKESVGRDYFPKPKASPYKGICRQGLFSRAEFIPIQRNLPAGIIFPSRNHPYSEESVSRDYFPEPNSSPLKRIHLQGCFGNIEGIRQIPESNFWMHSGRKPLPDSRDISRCDHW